MNQLTTLPRSGQEKIDLLQTLKRKTAKIHEKVREESWAQRVRSSDCTLTGHGKLALLTVSFGNQMIARHLLPNWGQTS